MLRGVGEVDGSLGFAALLAIISPFAGSRLDQMLTLVFNRNYFACDTSVHVSSIYDSFVMMYSLNNSAVELYRLKRLNYACRLTFSFSG